MRNGIYKVTDSKNRSFTFFCDSPDEAIEAAREAFAMFDKVPRLSLLTVTWDDDDENMEGTPMEMTKMTKIYG